MTIVVTGAAGFIGSNLVKALNHQGEYDIIAVDHLIPAEKFLNLVDCEIADYFDKDEFLTRLIQGQLGKIQAILHQGACSDTMETNGQFMIQNNFRYSQELLSYCQQNRIPFLYASSAAVYGSSQIFREERQFENPLNIYGYSKFLFDQVVRQRLDNLTAPVIGFRYFNVYGPRESHKGRMASVAFHHFNQYNEHRKVTLFSGWAGYESGCQQRDFISIEDVIKINLHFLNQPQSGIYNVGTGRAQTFNEVALAVINTLRQKQGLDPLSLSELVKQGLLEYMPFPDVLKGKYQSYTQADIQRLRAAGYQAPFLTVAEGVARYIESLSRVNAIK